MFNFTIQTFTNIYLFSQTKLPRVQTTKIYIKCLTVIYSTLVPFSGSMEILSDSGNTILANATILEINLPY